MYEYEAQTIIKMEALEMWFGRLMLRIPWTAKRANIEVMEEG